MISGAAPVPKLFRLLVSSALKGFIISPLRSSLAQGACVTTNGLLMRGQVYCLGFYHFTSRGMIQCGPVVSIPGF